MSQNVCIIVPVHNVEQVLHHRMMNLIDVISELTDDFEIRIIDDSSIDGTYEIACQLAKEYPQVHAVRTSEQLGIAIAAESEMDTISASNIFVHDISQCFSLTKFMKLWRESMVNASNGFSTERIDQVHLHHGLQFIRRPRVADQQNGDSNSHAQQTLSRLQQILQSS